MCLPLFFCPPPRRAQQHRPRLSRACAAPAICPQQHPPRLSRACHRARAPALISAQFYFFDPPLLFPPGPRGSEKTPSYLPNFCALEPAKLNVRARSTYRARAARVRTGAFSNYRAGGIVRGRLVTAQAALAGVPLVIVGAAACRAAVLAACVPPGVVCLGVGGVLAVGVGAGAGVAVVWCWLVSCCPVLLVVGGLLAGGVV